MKHGARNGLFVVTLGWFVDSVRKEGERERERYAYNTGINWVWC